MADRFSFCGSTAGPFNSGANHLWSHQTGAAPDPGRTGRFRSWDPRRTAAAHPRAAAPARSGGSGRQGTPRSCTSARHRRPTGGVESRGRAWAFPSPVSLNLRTTTLSSTDQRPATMLGEWLWPWRLVSLRVGWCPLVAGGSPPVCRLRGPVAGGPMCACRMARITLSGHLGCGAEASLARPRTVGSGQLRRRISSCTDSTSVVKFSSRTTRVASARATPLLKAAPPK